MKKSILICLGFIMMASISYAQNYTVLRNFTNNVNDGHGIAVHPIVSGTTLYGISGSNMNGKYGILYKMETDGTDFSILHSFPTPYPEDGYYPSTSLLLDGTSLYGMTNAGGTTNNGVIYKINTNGTGYTILHSFNNDSGGKRPYYNSSLTMSANKLYGVLRDGGTNSLGTIFSIKTDGSEFSVLYSFSGGHNDGAYPFGSLIVSNSSIYGITYMGGAGNAGTIYKINQDGSGFSILHTFAKSEGFYPVGSMVLSGTVLYGTTSYGGVDINNDYYGIIFKINTDGSGYTRLHTFMNQTNNGINPFGALILSDNFLYGTTIMGGPGGRGTVYRINIDGTGFSLLHSFPEFSGDGINPYHSSIAISNNTLYGGTIEGGTNNFGMIFSIKLIPTLTTTSISNISDNSANCGGRINNENNIENRGVCWNTTGNPTINDSYTTDGTGSGTFTSSISGLSPSTKYFVRAYATNRAGTGYGQEMNFRTLSSEPNSHTNSFTAISDCNSSINLSFQAPGNISNCSGYIILRRQGSTSPNIIGLDDGTAPGSLLLPSGTTLASVITNLSASGYYDNGLTVGNQYSYTIIPFNWDGSHTETYNYLTIGVMPSLSIIFADTIPPTISVSLNQVSLWPPNHSMRTVNATVSTSDNCSVVTYILESITSNEPDNGQGDGDTPNDIQNAGFNTEDLSFSLRAERSGNGNARVYTITYLATDASGNQARAMGYVTVPLNRSREKGELIFGYDTEDYTNTYLYPNPTIDYINILSNESLNNKEVTIINVLGIIVIQKTIQNGTNTIDVSELPTGIYIIDVNGMKRKFVKN
ncbi:MAG: hypothetical protein HW421_1960 [Ignavibacteria bacterium]|nr:hypothetical protein [Ignavibacteria bacterium]